MDLTPIYELRDRLRSAAVAGTGLLTEDFRLKRAAEGLKPLEKVPVFAKIGQLMENLFEPECENRAGALLDALSLVDAVICTLGTVEVSGEITPLETEAAMDGGKAMDVPYSLLHGLLEALTTSGSGHYNYVLETHETHPELFADYRIQQALVKALGAGYSELAEQAESWLKEQGKSILPLLMRNFDPQGKKDMVRRVRVISAVAGADANDFYLGMLEAAAKDVRQELIYALRHDEANVDMLIDMTKTEKGKNKQAAYWALAEQQGEKTENFWREFAGKKPGEAAIYLSAATSEWASDLAGGLFLSSTEEWAECNRKEKMQFTQEQAQLIDRLVCGIVGKCGGEIAKCYGRLVQWGDRFDQAMKEQLHSMKMSAYCQAYEMSNAKRPFLALILEKSILLNPAQELKELAYDLWEQEKKNNAKPDFLRVALLGKILSEEDCSEWIEEQLDTKGVWGRLFLAERKDAVSSVFREIVYCAPGSYKLKYTYFSEKDQINHIMMKTICQPVKEKFTDIAMKYGSYSYAHALSRWICPEDKEYCKRLEKWFHAKGLTAGKNAVSYIAMIKKCGGTDCSGLVVEYSKFDGNLDLGYLHAWLLSMPGEKKAIADEAEKIVELIERGEIKGRICNGVDIIKKWIIDWRNE